MNLMQTKWSPLIALFVIVISAGPAAAEPATLSPEAQRGQYLVTGTGCNDCHTPLKMGAAGPEPDMTRMLSGHPETMVMPAAPKLPEGVWMGSFSATMTAWAGPWGVSYAANLTPDPETGLGKGWTDKVFIETIRNGRHLGKGRQILPPMPYPAMANLTDADLSAIFAYLQTIPAVHNKVPAPIIAEAPGPK